MATVELLNLDDLELDELDVTTLRDTVALPATGASTNPQAPMTAVCGCGSCKTQFAQTVLA